jgi:hypothetical protein
LGSVTSGLENDGRWHWHDVLKNSLSKLESGIAAYLVKLNIQSSSQKIAGRTGVRACPPRTKHGS